MASITLLEFSQWNNSISTAISAAIPTNTRLRNRSSVGLRQMSTQKLVVNAVIAESAEENEAATMPSVNSTTTVSPSPPVAANMGSSSSPLAGNATPR